MGRCAILKVMEGVVGHRVGLSLAAYLAVSVAAAASASAQSGYQTINGTRVYTVIDQAAGIATFSNECGTQRLTQRELQGGAIPSRIIPCPRPTSPKLDDARGLNEAKVFWREAEALFNDKSYGAAADKFEQAAKSFSRAGNPKGVELARREVRRSVCYDFATRNWSNAGELQFHNCGEFADMVKRIAERIEHLNRAGTRQEPEKLIVALITTESGLFYGTAEARGGAAWAAAEALCQRYKGNTATTAEERNETCTKSIVSTDGCVALARSHDMYWGTAARRFVGLGSAKPASAASERALAECKRAGGQNCFVVPEAVRCVGDGSRS